ncbi:defender against apoptotic cell death 1 [Capsaspora owczarzaki ATCC 30864]|uniref:Dolichyl-diphosphooligosaccharide--protein glycosyltransferase subunit OST2 n=1 Tax=Capsaspora owczarzaki (strain ATCC 30864) TaxID=595528 RepID=A0A0D2WWC4_CAPO3|nr:defender against apoptotic cell death 1 [Capsaspora owczarzaki ATCC 30864]KJE97270.1 defender against apoptotic cell death 1 [Capsaspora owczarzaki ATCC 30864]|eukprot:XP_004343580.1 defender against apoptotic cell death 1 [Capsaspora owczarzaki ATCC 30864]
MSNPNSIGNVVAVLAKRYTADTPQLIKVIDAYLVYIMLTGIAQFVYCALVGTFPFNAFLAGFISTIGSFVLAVGLRLQVNPKNGFENISRERSFADFLFCHVVLHFVVMNFLG